MCWRGGGARTWCVDDTHDGPPRTRRGRQGRRCHRRPRRLRHRCDGRRGNVARIRRSHRRGPRDSGGRDRRRPPSGVDRGGLDRSCRSGRPAGRIGRPRHRGCAAGFGVARRRCSGPGGRSGGGLRQDRADVRRTGDGHAGDRRDRRWLSREGPERKSAWRRRNRRRGRDGHRSERPGISAPGPVRRRLRRRCHRGQGTFDGPRPGARHRARRTPARVGARCGAGVGECAALRPVHRRRGLLARSRRHNGPLDLGGRSCWRRRRFTGRRRFCFGPRRRAGTQQAVPIGRQLADRHLRRRNDGTDHRGGGQCPADRGSRLGRRAGSPRQFSAASRGAGCAARRGEAGAHAGAGPRSRRTTSCPHRDGTAEGPATPAATASGGAQRRARTGGGARTGRSTPARCGSTGNPAADHPVAGPVCSTDSATTPVLQPAAARPDVVPGSELAVWTRRLHMGTAAATSAAVKPVDVQLLSCVERPAAAL